MNPVVVLALAFVLAVVGIVVLSKVAWLGMILLILGFLGFLFALNRNRNNQP